MRPSRFAGLKIANLTEMYLYWRKEGSRLALRGTEYVLTSAPALPDHIYRLIDTLSKIWEEALGGKRVSDKAISNSFMLQIVVELCGASILIDMLVQWYMVSQSYELPSIPEALMPESAHRPLSTVVVVMRTSSLTEVCR